ncbi:MAG: hypothetical protein AAF633_11075 [Chloroflexota bacterium]
MSSCLAEDGAGRSNPSPTPTAGRSIIVDAASLPTLAPTYTRVAASGSLDDQIENSDQISAAGTATPRPSPSATVDLTQPVLSYRLTIVALGFDRSLEGTVAGMITLTDHTSGQTATLRNQNRRLIEIQAVLQALSLDPISGDCFRCTAFSYQLPIEGILDDGHLTDPILLASVHHLFSSELGPHFPAGVVAAHHREASGLTAEHAAVLTDEGLLWAWFAADSIIEEPTEVGVEASQSFRQQSLDLLESDYLTACQNFPIETVYYNGEQFRTQCPELALPTTLILPYEQITLISDLLLADERNLDLPTTSLPLNARIYYERQDGGSLTLFDDGLVITDTGTGERITTTIPTREIAPLIDPMIQSGVIPRGVEVSIQAPPLEGEPAEFEELILIRGDLGVYELAWSDQAGQALVPGIVVVDLLLSDKIGPLVEDEVNEVEEATPAVEPTPTTEGDGDEDDGE